MKHSKLRIYMVLILGMILMVNGCGSSNNQAASGETMQENDTEEGSDITMNIMQNFHLHRFLMRPELPR